MYPRKLRMRHAALLGIQVSFSSQVRLSLLVKICIFYPDLADCMFSLSPGTFLPPSKPFQGEYEDFRDGGVTVSFLAERYRKIFYLSSFPELN